MLIQHFICIWMMEQVVKLYVCDLTTGAESEALYTCQYFFKEGELVAILKIVSTFWRNYLFCHVFCFKELRKV